jgi:hypothetical protein
MAPTITIMKTIARISASVLAAGMLLGLAATSANAATPANPTLPANCVQHDGTSPTGKFLGGSPPRWVYGVTPYIGVHWDSCESVFKVHYGGYTGITHYNIAWTAPWFKTPEQREVGPGTAQVFTLFDGVPGFNAPVTFRVQACKRGGTFQRSSCTPWSPAVTVQASK